MVGLQLLGGGHGRLETGRGERGQERARDRLIELDPADRQAPHATPVDQGAAGAVVAGRRPAAPVVGGQPASAAPADRDALQQRRALAHRAPGLVGLGADVGGDAGLVSLVGRPVDEPGVMVGNQDLPLGLGQPAGTGPHLPRLGDIALVAGLAVDVGASIDRAGDNVVDGRIGRLNPADLVRSAQRGRLQRERQALGAKPQPGRPHAAEVGEAGEHRADRATDLLVGVEADLAVGLAPHEPDRQAPAQLASGGLAADSAFQPGAQHVQLRLAHRALQAKHQPVVERPRVIQAIAVADQRVGDGAQVQQPIPVGVVAGQAADLQAQHQPDVAEGDLGGQTGKPRTVGHT